MAMHYDALRFPSCPPNTVKKALVGMVTFPMLRSFSRFFPARCLAKCFICTGERDSISSNALKS